MLKREPEKGMVKLEGGMDTEDVQKGFRLLLQKNKNSNILHRELSQVAFGLKIKSPYKYIGDGKPAKPSNMEKISCRTKKKNRNISIQLYT